MFESYLEALTFLESRKSIIFEKSPQTDFRLRRVKKLLHLLNDPQERIKIIHIAGTSGKGSTASLIAFILEKSNLKVGLTVSPHVYDFLERFQINGENISESLFLSYLNQILPSIKQIEVETDVVFSYYELITVLSFVIFESQKVDYAVIEVGIGGLLDATNVVQNRSKINVITPIDFDHTEILGKKLSEIAWQKAGIIQSNQMVFSSPQAGNAKKVIIEQCHKTISKLEFVNEGTSGAFCVNKIKTNEFGTKFNVKLEEKWLNDIILSQLGYFQALNCALALTVCDYLQKRDDLKLDFDQIKTKLRLFKIAGRFERITYQDREVILDIAHNPHKIKALIQLIQRVYPGVRFNIIFATAKNKDSVSMLNLLSPITEHLFLTQYESKSPDNAKSSQEISTFSEIIGKIRHIDRDHIYLDQNLNETIQKSLNTSNNTILVIGSAFLVREAKGLLKNFQN